ncbi:major facilitator superfamily domain-containing protein 10 isoform X2 [Cynocephalus volans]|uniref:major facilitator superfamily domain-containing protein 10 isoform X2 n=1 Tax=Cynocephalus volans TaxID=110931 RepID=UPI002FC75E8F
MGWGAPGGCTPRPPIRPRPAPERRVVTAVFLGLLLDLLAFTLLLPLLPALLESHGRAHDPLYGSWQRGVDWLATAIGMPAEQRYNSVLFGGLIGSAFSVLQFLSAPLTGAVSDCLGRRPVMLLSLTGLATSYAVWATSRSFKAFLASRVIGGISKGNVSLSTAIVADLGSPPARSRGMAVIGVAFSLGFTLGPMLGASLRVETAPWFALLFAVSNLLFVFCFLPETLPPEKRASSVSLGVHAAADLLSPLALLRFSAVARGQDPPTGDRLGSLRRLGLVYFSYLFLFSGLEFTLSFLVHQRFQFSRPSCCWYLPSSSLAGGTLCPCWAWGCCSTPLPLRSWCPACPLWLPAMARQGRKALSWALCGAWEPWLEQWGPWWLPQCTGWLGPRSASPCARGSSCSLSSSCGS